MSAVDAGDDEPGAPVLRLRRQRRAPGRLVDVAFTDVSLDLSEREGTDPGVLAEALAAVGRATGGRVARMHQRHGGAVAVLDEAPDDPPEVDALVTDRDGLVLMTRAADCVPVLLADAGGSVVAAVHAGRAGVLAGVAVRAAERMRERGAGDLVAWVGPHVCGACYEVPEEMRAEVAAAVPAAWAETRWGTPGLDLGAGVAAQLAAVGCEVVELGGCTMEDPGLPSHRRDGAGATRLAGLVWMTDTVQNDTVQNGTVQNDTVQSEEV